MHVFIDLSTASIIPAGPNMVHQKRYAPEKPRRCLGFFVFGARSRRERFTVDILDVAVLI